MPESLTVTIDELRAGLHGSVVRPGDDAYENARRIWNAMIDKHPALIVRCASADDVIRTIRFARSNRLPLAVRGGGHHIAGHATCDGGVVLDLSSMRSARVDPVARRVVVEAGATLADLDAATQAHGLATPVGINSTTGIAGLTLGGGFGWLSRQYGMTVDNLESAEIVTAAGEVVKASGDEHPDLFWALRGGGGNFGVVTRFEFRLHPVGPGVLSGLIVFPLSQARSVLQRFREFIPEAPDDFTAWAVLRKAPPLPFLPPAVHGDSILAIAVCHAGDPDTGARLAEEIQKFGTPVGEHVGIQPYIAWQQAFDPLLTAGARNYWKSHNLAGLEDGLLDVVIDHTGRLPSPQCEIFVASLGGATLRPAPESMAYAHRDTRFVMNVHGRWNDPADDERGKAWAREFYQASMPFAGAGVYVNFMTEEETGRVRAAYGSNYPRLVEVKRRYDPENLFRLNQNIEPA